MRRCYVRLFPTISYVMHCEPTRTVSLLQVCRGRHTSLHYRFGFRTGAKGKIETRVAERVSPPEDA